MADTVNDFIAERVERAIDSYEEHKDQRFKKKHEEDPTIVFLSDDLFSRLLREDRSQSGTKVIHPEDVVVVKGEYPEYGNMSFVILVHSCYEEGYDPAGFGLKEEKVKVT